MPSLAEIQAQKQALTAARQAGAIADPLAGIRKAPEGTVVAGMQSEVHSADTVAQPPVALYEIDADKAAGAKKVYKDLTLHHYIPASCVRTVAEKGYFYAATDDDVTQLDHYAKKGLVEVAALEPSKK